MINLKYLYLTSNQIQSLQELESLFQLESIGLTSNQIESLKGIEKLMKNPKDHGLYALDKFWFHIQEKHNWYLIIPLTVVQRADYSDIEKRATDYTRLMTDLHKVEFIKAQKAAYAKAQLSPAMIFGRYLA